MPFPTFAPAHLAILAAIPLVAGALARFSRGHPDRARRVRLALAAVIAVDELAFYAYLVAAGAVRPPHGLPLDLCDVVVWVTVYALVSMRAWALEIAWFLGLAGSGMAVLTPDVGAELLSYEGMKFFVAHGGVVIAALVLAWTEALRPRPGAWWRVFLYVNVYAALVALFDARFGTNYMYLRQKPESGTLLDRLGPWPWYVLAAEPVALLLLWALDLPFRRAPGRTQRFRGSPAAGVSAPGARVSESAGGDAMEQKIRVGRFTSPDEQRKFGQGHMDVLKLGSATIGRAEFEPGWRWSNDVKPIAKTKSCEASHTIFVVSGRMHVEMDDGEAVDIEPGECAVIPPGHDAWILGDTACVTLDFTGAATYATEAREARTGAASEAQPGAGAH